jgi:Na+/glutamate symporter
MVAPFILPVAVAGGLGLLALSPCAQSVDVTSMPANAMTKRALILVVFIRRY